MPWQYLCFGYSALIVKRNFQQTNPFECFFFLKIDLKTSIALQSYFAANIQISESLHREFIFKHDL